MSSYKICAKAPVRVTPRKAPVKAPVAKTAYQKFMNDEVPKQQVLHPAFTHKQLMTAAAEEWAKQKASTSTTSVTKPVSEPTTPCLSIRSMTEPQYQCLMPARGGNSYCHMHLTQKRITNYKSPAESYSSSRTASPTVTINPAIPVVDIDEVCKPVGQKPNTPKPPTSGTMFEQKASTIADKARESEMDLNIKLLILINSEATDVMERLIGPVFADVCLSEDEQDPITYDDIWTWQNGIKVPACTNKYYLFSYTDTHGKIRCMTIFTIQNMIESGNCTHPITSEPIPEPDVLRARELIDLYQSKLNLFSIDESNLSPEFKLRNRLTRLFKQFHMHSIFFEEDWLLSITDLNQLQKIIRETGRFVSNNIRNINPQMKSFRCFDRGAKGRGPRDSPFTLHKYIVKEWERLIAAADSPQNQVPIWILASGLTFAVPAVKAKYPDLEMML
ncbi:Hypothetical protein MVR_LOCUS215 [uncultured virus]|nr:Hypothetical protein MVR_LOCUS215 [uncultured virus]